jgi:hypothetical protein
MSTKKEQKELAKREGALAKALAMTVLFNKGRYEAITGVLDRIGSENIVALEADFKAKCGTAIDDDEKAWLWNYLKHYNKDLADSTDKKWKVEVTDGNPHW